MKYVASSEGQYWLWSMLMGSWHSPSCLQRSSHLITLFAQSGLELYNRFLNHHHQVDLHFMSTTMPEVTTAKVQANAASCTGFVAGFICFPRPCMEITVSLATLNCSIDCATERQHRVTCTATLAPLWDCKFAHGLPSICSHAYYMMMISKCKKYKIHSLGLFDK